MEIKYKLYPYPVLSAFSDDYKNGKFDVAIDPVRDGYNLRIDFLATLTSSALTELIRTGSAKYVYHLECSQTGFRTVFQTDKTSSTYPLSSKMINGKLQICPVVVATSDIQNYVSDDFHDDYKGIGFDIEAGCVLAVGKMVTLDISKDIDELANTPSIFSIIRNADAGCNQMLIDMGQRKIIIKLPLNDYYSYKQLSKTPQAQAILNAITIVPALTYVLEELARIKVEERMEYTDLLWYRILSKTLMTQFQVDIESPEYENQHYIQLAQKLINDPLAEAFQMLATEFGTSGEDEE